MININGIDWDIALVAPNDPLLRMRDNFFAIGVCDAPLRLIAINDELNNFYLKKVLCHELTHAAMFSYGIDLDYMQEEVIADLMATYGQEIICQTNKIFKRIAE